MPSPLWPEPVFMTYRVWVLPLPIPLQFSDKQKHIQALASHFTLCALAGGNAFLEPLAYSPKNGSSWLSFLKKEKERRGGRQHMWRIRPHLSSFTLSAHPWLPEPSVLPVSWTFPEDTLTLSLHLLPTYVFTWQSLYISVPPPLCLSVVSLSFFF